MKPSKIIFFSIPGRANENKVQSPYQAEQNRAEKVESTIEMMWPALKQSVTFRDQKMQTIVVQIPTTQTIYQKIRLGL